MRSCSGRRALLVRSASYIGEYRRVSALPQTASFHRGQLPQMVQMAEEETDRKDEVGSISEDLIRDLGVPHVRRNESRGFRSRTGSLAHLPPTGIVDS
jgi:hypothetical protein